MKMCLVTMTVFALMQASMFTLNAFADEPNEPNIQKKVSDVNSVEKKQKKSKEIFSLETEEYSSVTKEDKIWQDVEKAGEQEGGQWLKTDAENIASLAKDVNENSFKELMILRKIAEEDKAEKTVQAIDKLISIRGQRYQQVIDKAKDERRQRILQQREERKNRAAERRGSAETRTMERPVR